MVRTQLARCPHVAACMSAHLSRHMPGSWGCVMGEPCLFRVQSTAVLRSAYLEGSAHMINDYATVSCIRANALLASPSTHRPRRMRDPTIRARVWTRVLNTCACTQRPCELRCLRYGTVCSRFCETRVCFRTTVLWAGRPTARPPRLQNVSNQRLCICQCTCLSTWLGTPLGTPLSTCSCSGCAS